MDLKFRLLDHPFYQAWTAGEVTPEQLSNYHKSYAEFIELMPQYWEKISNAFAKDSELAKEVIADETGHIELWQKWFGRLPQTDSFPKMTEVINSMSNMTPSELLGAVQAFEMQQPEVAKTKKEGLILHYGFTEKETLYSDDHMVEEEHIQFGNYLRENFANKDEYQKGFDKGAELFYNGLNLFTEC